MKIKVLLNATSRFMPYSDGDELDLVLDMEACDEHAPQCPEMLNAIFVELNIDEPRTDWGKDYRNARNRSLSVGDVITVGEMAYACEPMGWRAVTVRAEQVIDGQPW